MQCYRVLGSLVAGVARELVMKGVVIVILAAFLLFVADRMVRIENQRYALLIANSHQVHLSFRLRR